MNRPVSHLWPLAAFASLPWLFLAAFNAIRPVSGGPLLSVLTSMIILMGWGRYRWAVPFIRRVRRFRTLASPRSHLHYAAEAEGRSDLASLAHLIEAELDDLAQRFGFALPRRPVVYLFATWREIGSIFGEHTCGRAVPMINAIVIAADLSSPEVVGHELVHLFSARWNDLAPPLLNEGLAVWMQGTSCGTPIDSVALPLIRQQTVGLPVLLNSKIFFSRDQILTCYILAGSFTGFLLRRHGWEKYRRFFRSASPYLLLRTFRKVYGVSLEKAEWQWRNELLAMEVLKRKLERDLRS